MKTTQFNFTIQGQSLIFPEIIKNDNSYFSCVELVFCFFETSTIRPIATTKMILYESAV